MTRYCRCPGPHCFDQVPQCGECDEDGYALQVRRRLKRRADGDMQDIDDQQVFRVKKTKTGDRLLPKFFGSMDWKSARGFAAMLLILSCLGTESEYVLWDSERNKEMDVEAWRKRRYINTSMPPVKHMKCGDVTTTTNIASLIAGGGIGCVQCVPNKKRWSQCYNDFVRLIPDGYKLQITQQDWQKQCTGNSFCPPIFCERHEQVVTTSSIANTIKGQGIGCSGCVTSMNLWRYRFDEFVPLLPDGYELRMTKHDWINECIDSDTFCPPIYCREHDILCEKTHIKSICQGKRPGCSGCVSSMNTWSGRFDEFVEHLPDNHEVRLTRSEWEQQCTGASFIPPIHCRIHNRTTTSTRLSDVLKGNVGCVDCIAAKQNQWCLRYDEFVSTLRDCAPLYELRLTKQEWMEQCNNEKFCPPIYCKTHDVVVTSTSISHAKNGHIGCPGCKNKTEGKLHTWLKEHFPSSSGVIISTQYSGPKTAGGGQTHFDFHLRFPDDFEVIVELDGAQHFWVHLNYYSNAGCERDLLKEEWAIAKGLSVVRVLQEDVWADRLGWNQYLTKSIEAARSGEPRVITPDAPEYRSSESEYVRLRD